MKAQLQKNKVNKAQMKTTNRSVNLLGKRSRAAQKTSCSVPTKKDQKKDNKNDCIVEYIAGFYTGGLTKKKEEQEKKAQIATEKEKTIEAPIEELSLKQQEPETSLLTEHKGNQTDDVLLTSSAAPALD